MTYSVVEDEEIYNVTIVRRGEPGEDIVVSISPNIDPTSPDTAESKELILQSKVSAVIILACEL